MITLGYIVELADDKGYKWKVNIPILHGLPDSKLEAELFKSWVEYEQRLLESKKQPQPKSALERLLYALKVKILLVAPREPTDLEKLFVSVASVCSMSGCITKYMPKDVVVIGFLDNSMDRPIILGSYLTEDIQELSITYPLIKASSILLDTNDNTSEVVLPRNTKFVYSDDTTLTLDDIHDAIMYIKSLLLGTNATLLGSVSDIVSDKIESILPTTTGS